MTGAGRRPPRGPAERALPRRRGGSPERRRLWGWYFFDWASQPYATLILTFVFAPYLAQILGDGSRAQAAWGWGVAAAGAAIALLAPVLGAFADAGGRRRPWILGFSALYVVGAAGLWIAAPGEPRLGLVLLSFAIGLMGVEFATIFTNAMLPDVAPPGRIGRVSGSGWAFGYLGGLVALGAMLAFFAEDAATGRTMAGLAPAFGLDPAAREGTRFAGPFTALWYAVFMVPFFAWLGETPRPRRPGGAAAVLAELGRSLRGLPRRRSLSAFLAASMLYRDALNGLYTFGGVYAAGVMGWGLAQIGAFGLLAIVAGAVFAWAGGHADAAFGPKRVIVAAIAGLALGTALVAGLGPGTLFGQPTAQADLLFYAAGAAIGAAGGALQAASRSLMAQLGDPARMTEAFGLYALAGKATSFLAPAAVALTTTVTGSQSAGILPLIALFLSGLVLLAFVETDGGRAA